MEVHNKNELEENLHDEIDLIGINNRNFKTFKVDLDTSIELAQEIPGKYIKVSESGISDPEAVLKLKSHGFKGFLIGEYFMGHSRPEQACAEFVVSIKKLESEIG